MDTHDEEYHRLYQKQREFDKQHKATKTVSASDPLVSYAIEILQRHLLNEYEAMRDANDYLDGGSLSQISPPSEHATRIAFIESDRLAKSRIPQLTRAIEILNGKTK